MLVKRQVLVLGTKEVTWGMTLSPGLGNRMM